MKFSAIFFLFVVGASKRCYYSDAFQIPNINPIISTPTHRRLGGRSTTVQVKLANKNNNDNKVLVQEEQEDKGNPFVNFISSVLSSSPSSKEEGKEEVVVVLETEEERYRRLTLERRQQLDEGELKRQQRVKEDAIPYLFLLSLQFLPILSGSDLFANDDIQVLKNINQLYFLGTAITTVYLGSRQETIFLPERVSKQNALAAPISAAIWLTLLYFLIKNGIDPTSVAAVIVSIFGIISISDIFVPILRNAVEALNIDNDLASREIDIPKRLAQIIKLDPLVESKLPLDGILTLVLGIAATALYWTPLIPMEQKFLVSNVIAWSIGMVSLGAISLGSFQTAAILLVGLFFYDIFFVFGTDVMVTVALKLEAPVKFLYPAPPNNPLLSDAPPRVYPFSVLGLGDIVVPGLFVRFMTKVDEELQPQTFSYATAGTIAYAVGLVVCFVVNTITNAGQPALLYLDPACIGSALACGAANGQLDQLLTFEEKIPDTE